MNLKCLKMVPQAKIPSRNKGDNGFDLSVIADDNFIPRYDDGKEVRKSIRIVGQRSVDNGNLKNSFILAHGARYLFSTGIKIQLPEKHFAMLRPRSGLANKNGIQVLGGLIDESYLGEWKVILYNTGEDFVIYEGDRIAQFVVVKDDDYQCVEVNESDLQETNRGEKGFGSSGA